MSESQILSIFHLHIPERAIAYCFQLWKGIPFDLKLTKTRQTKVGDFICRKGSSPRISINQDLNPYLFLLTFIHEVAHLHVHVLHGNRVEAHGDIWKKTFQQLLNPLLTVEYFPGDILPTLVGHMENPKASTFSDSELTRVLRAYDRDADSHIVLATLTEGSVFKLQGRYFKKGKIRRTRFLCRDVQSKRMYLIPADALVAEAQLSLL